MKRTTNLAIAWILAFAIQGYAAEAGSTEGQATPSEEPAATTSEEQQNPSEWQFEVAPYLWWSGVKSTVKFGEVESSSDISFLDALDHLKFGGLIHAEATNGRWGVMGDVVYLKLGAATDKRLGGRLRWLSINAKADMEQTMVELGGFYRIPGERVSFDLLAGGRYFGFGTDVEIGPFKLSRDKDWIDPLVGGRFNARLSDRWGFSLRGDVGGFGVGSDTTWNATALFRYRLTENSDLGIGYRYLDVEKSSSDGAYDAVTSGPLLGMSIKF